MEQTQARQPSPTEAEVIAAIAIGLAALEAIPDPKKYVADALVLLAPAFLAPALQARLTLLAAELVLRNPIDPPGPGEAEIRAHEANLRYRAAYGVAAVKRLVEAIRGPGDENRLEKALRREASYLEGHINASESRHKGAQLNDAVASVYGDELGWRHGPVTEHSRSHHVAAHGSNYRVSQPPVSTEGLPGLLPGCDCVPGPPFAGGRMLS